MIYKAFKDKQLSALGMGCMRLPLTPENTIDEEAVLRMFTYALDNGVNYFDTAWGYHAGQSELVVGKTLEHFPRESFYLASKFPGFTAENFEKKEEIFARQLEKCRVSYFDFYLLHCVSESNIDMYLDENYGLLPYLREQIRAGRIRHLGFSAHCSMEVFRRLLEAYADDMEFCQLQINYIDWDFQEAKEKVALLNSYNIPVWVMEPLRGGSLCNLSARYKEELRTIRPDEEAPAVAFRFLQSIPEVVVTLSGMSSEQQLIENIETYKTDSPLTPDEFDRLRGIGKRVIDSIPCTACRYCTDYCPQKVDIPTILRIYNEYVFGGDKEAARAELNAIPVENGPAACVACGACEAVCPQKIKIPDVLAKIRAALA